METQTSVFLTVMFVMAITIVRIVKTNLCHVVSVANFVLSHGPQSKQCQLKVVNPSYWKLSLKCPVLFCRDKRVRDFQWPLSAVMQ